MLDDSEKAFTLDDVTRQTEKKTPHKNGMVEAEAHSRVTRLKNSKGFTQPQCSS